MRHVLAVLTLIHGIGHVPGFAVSWRLLTTQELPYRTTILHGRLDLGDVGIRAWGLIWLALCVAFGVLAVGIWSRSSWWLGALTTAVGISTLCCLFALPEARLGLATNAIVFVLACVAVRFPDGSPAVGHPGLQELWRSAPAGSGAVFDPGTVAEAGKPYLRQAIAPGTLLASSVRLCMHGEIKLGGNWQPFQAEQVIVPRRGMIWAGTVSMFGLPLRGADQILDGSGLLLWKLLDIVPVAHAEGPDTSRSGIGRLLGETAAWLPSVLCAAPTDGNGLEWIAIDQHHIRLRLGAFGENVELAIELDDSGQIRAFSFPRWAIPMVSGIATSISALSSRKSVLLEAIRCPRASGPVGITARIALRKKASSSAQPSTARSSNKTTDCSTIARPAQCLPKTPVKSFYTGKCAAPVADLSFFGLFS